MTLDRWAKRWPTPTAGDSKASGSRNLEGSQAHAGVSLTDAVKFGNSSTPRWPTPTADDADNVTRASGAYQSLTRSVMWPTPNAGMEKHSTKDAYWANRVAKGRQNDLQMATYLETGSGALNPTWVEWLMGFPLGWTDLGPSETRLSRKSSKSSGGG